MIGAVIVIAVVVAVLCRASGVGTGGKAPAGNSKCSMAGLRVINGTADAQVDVREPLSAESIGLPANSSKTFGPFVGIQLEVDFIGTHGTESLFVDSMRVTTRHGAVTSITTSAHDYGFLFIRNQLQSLSVLGLTTRQMADFENSMPAGAGGANSYFHLPFGVGTALGIPTAVTVACAGPQGCTVATNTTLRQK